MASKDFVPTHSVDIKSLICVAIATGLSMEACLLIYRWDLYKSIGAFIKRHPGLTIIAVTCMGGLFGMYRRALSNVFIIRFK